VEEGGDADVLHTFAYIVRGVDAVVGGDAYSGASVTSSRREIEKTLARLRFAHLL